MKKQKIYIVRNLNFKEVENKKAIIYNVDNVAFKSVEKAIEYIESKLTDKDIEDNKKMHNRKLLEWYKFLDKDYQYEIKEVDLI